MTNWEKIVVSAYTGFLMCDFNELHEYIEKKLGRPVWTHEMASEKFCEALRDATKEDFQKICNSADAPDVIRCKDCKWLTNEYGWNRIEYSVCGISPTYHPLRKEYDFCSKAERRTDGCDSRSNKRNNPCD